MSGNFAAGKGLMVVETEDMEEESREDDRVGGGD